MKTKDSLSPLLLGITGGIAAYKTPELVRRLRDAGYAVRVVMTHGAQAFVTPLSLQAVSGEPVRDDLWDPQAEAAMGHIELARWAQQILIAPASAHFIAKLAHGHADDLLTTLCLATQAPIYIAPSMNRVMWDNPATQANIALLTQRGIQVIPPAQGEQACGEHGAGRLPEPAALISALQQPAHTPLLAGKHIVITAGPTQEGIDPVRFISNHSSGKMGYALAQAAQRMGAQVTLISGPVALKPPAGVKTLAVRSAKQMHQAVLDQVTHADVFIGTAAVADYRPAHSADQKIQKSQQALSLELVRNPDILADVAQLPYPPITVGFAAQTHDVVARGQAKRLRKKLDMICINDVSQTDQGFHSDYNAITLITDKQQIDYPRTLKTTLAEQILTQVATLISHKQAEHHA